MVWLLEPEINSIDAEVHTGSTITVLVVETILLALSVTL